jgi:hypothetical protein
MSPANFGPLLNISDEHSRPYDVLETGTGLPKCVANDFDAAAGLRVCVTLAY